MQRCLRRIVRWQLPGRRNSVGCSNVFDLPEDRQLVFRNWSAAQNLDLAVAYRNNGRFNSVGGWPCVDDHRNTTVEFIEDMLRSCGADSPKAICTWRGQ